MHLRLSQLGPNYMARLFSDCLSVNGRDAIESGTDSRLLVRPIKDVNIPEGCETVAHPAALERSVLWIPHRPDWVTADMHVAGCHLLG